MPTPTRPVASAVIGTVWGQQTHDYTFAPAGCIVSGADVVMLAAEAYRTLPLDTADEDPGGYLDAANDRVEVPADGAGLYLIVLRIQSDDGAAGDVTSVVLQLNGADIGRTNRENDGPTDVVIDLTVVEPLTTGDQVSVRARQFGSGARADVRVRALTLVRLGAELGAPS